MLEQHHLTAQPLAKSMTPQIKKGISKRLSSKNNRYGFMISQWDKTACRTEDIQAGPHWNARKRNSLATPYIRTSPSEISNIREYLQKGMKTTKVYLKYVIIIYLIGAVLSKLIYGFQFICHIKHLDYSFLFKFAFVMYDESGYHNISHDKTAV